MLENIHLNDILFLDIETVPQKERFDLLPDHMKKLWEKKAGFIRLNEDETPDETYERAGIYAEFGKIICISTGYLRGNELRIKSFYGDDEINILNEFSSLLTNYYSKPSNYLCGHNSKEFDYPYIIRRMIVGGIPIPPILDLAGRKPWEVRHLDTMELWKFGDRKSYTSLDLLSVILNIPSPKNDIDGSDIASLYWNDKDMMRIVEYCQRDVLAVVQILLRFLGKPLIEEDQIVIVQKTDHND